MEPAPQQKRRKLGACKNNSNNHLASQETQGDVPCQSNPPFKVPGLIVTDHRLQVPLDHSGNTPGQLTIFVREISSMLNHQQRNMPVLLYLQGGPGFEAPRPHSASMWMKSAVSSFRVMLLDQRGTGLSSAITVANLAKQGTPQQQADYLAFFRADSIVADAEIVRKTLLGGGAESRWSLLGQSFGGFCAVTYLSQAPEGLVEVLLTGGLPPLVDQPCSAQAVYEATSQRVVSQNVRYYERFPGDVKVVSDIVKHLAAQPGGGVTTPSGSLLTPRSLQTLGLGGLGGGGGFERLHYQLESFFDCDGGVNPAFLKSFENGMSWDTNPLYSLLHESIYCQGAASDWAAQRVIETEGLAAQFDAVSTAEAGQPVMFTGEMVYPWMFDDIAALRPYKEAANILAAKSNWPALYDLQALKANRVPVAAISYVEDMYVDLALAQQTASKIHGLRHWVTSEYKHSGIRDDGGRIFDRLLNMARDGILPE
ncbi:MAG: hypothetical protein WDW36_004761 [Sanguina aurantia]